MGRWLGLCDCDYGDHGGKVAVLQCRGCDGCWPFAVTITVTDTTVQWSDFEQPHRSTVSPQAPWDYSGFDPEFRKDQYERELGKLDGFLRPTNRGDSPWLAPDVIRWRGRWSCGIWPGILQSRRAGGRMTGCDGAGRVPADVSYLPRRQSHALDVRRYHRRRVRPARDRPDGSNPPPTEETSACSIGYLEIVTRDVDWCAPRTPRRTDCGSANPTPGSATRGRRCCRGRTGRRAGRPCASPRSRSSGPTGSWPTSRRRWPWAAAAAGAVIAHPPLEIPGHGTRHLYPGRGGARPGLLRQRNVE